MRMMTYRAVLNFVCAGCVWVVGFNSPAYAGGIDLSGLLGDSSAKQLKAWQKNPVEELKLAEWDRIRLAPIQGSAINQHPFTLSAAQLTEALKNVQVKPSKGDAQELFSEDELKRLAGPLALALSVAKPDQDVEFLSTGQHSMTGIVAPAVGNAGRLFIHDGRLNVILGMAHKDFISDYMYGSRRPPKFDFGSRTRPVDFINISGVSGAEVRIVRADWIELPIPAVPFKPETGDSSASGRSAPLDSMTAEEIARKIALHLQALQLLKAQGQVTDEEYRSKRAEILQSLQVCASTPGR